MKHCTGVTKVDRKNRPFLWRAKQITHHAIQLACIAAALSFASCTPAPKNLLEAATVGDNGAVKRFLAAGENVNSIGPHDYTPLHVAAFNGKTQTVQLLLDNGANIEAKNDLGHTPVWEAALGDHPDIVGLLLDRGAKTNVVSTSGIELLPELRSWQKAGLGGPHCKEIIERLRRRPIRQDRRATYRAETRNEVKSESRIP